MGRARHGEEEPPPPRAYDAPEGFEAMRADAERLRVGSGGTFARDADDVAAFTVAGFMRVSVSDADELGGLDGEAWARAAMGRYVVAGSDRWARWWREGEHHVLRGHTYIGGCERTDVDVLVRERDGYLERWVAYATDLDAALGAAPSGARDVTDASRTAGRAIPRSAASINAPRATSAPAPLAVVGALAFRRGLGPPRSHDPKSSFAAIFSSSSRCCSASRHMPRSLPPSGTPPGSS